MPSLDPQSQSPFFVSHPTGHYTLTFTERPGYLVARIGADHIDRDIVTEYLREIVEKCIEVNARRLLFVRDISESLNTTDLFFTATDFAREMDGKSVALVSSYPNIESDMAFLVTVAQNRGGIFSLHRDMASAEEWLLSSIPH